VSFDLGLVPLLSAFAPSLCGVARAARATSRRHCTRPPTQLPALPAPRPNLRVTCQTTGTGCQLAPPLALNCTAGHVGRGGAWSSCRPAGDKVGESRRKKPFLAVPPPQYWPPMASSARRFPDGERQVGRQPARVADAESAITSRAQCTLSADQAPVVSAQRPPGCAGSSPRRRRAQTRTR
jgi:hypothetical protein